MKSFEDWERSLAYCTPLSGGTRSLVSACERQGGGTIVLREALEGSALAEEPGWVWREASALRLMEGGDVLAPRFLAAATDGRQALLMTKLPGAPSLQPADPELYAQALAEQLAHIHRTPLPADFAWRCPPLPARPPFLPEWADARSSSWTRALEAARGPRPATPARFLHCSFHPAHALWEGDALSGIADWTRAGIGPAGVDVAHCRLHLALLLGTEAANLFLRAYEQAAAYAHDVAFDALALFDYVGDGSLVPAEWTALGLESLTDALARERLLAYVDFLFLR